MKLKDLRSIGATSTAEAELAGITPTMTGDPVKDMKHIYSILRAVSTTVSERLNNTAAVARRSYIAPQVVQAWGLAHGVPKEWLE